MLFSDTCLNGMVEVLDQFEPFAGVIVRSEDLEPGGRLGLRALVSQDERSATDDAGGLGRQAVDAFGENYKNKPNLFPCTRLRSGHGTPSVSIRPLLHQGGRGEGRSAWWMLVEVRAGPSRSPAATPSTWRLREAAGGKGGGKTIDAAATALITALANARIRNVALGPQVPQANGLAFWFPADHWRYEETAGTYAETRVRSQRGLVEVLVEVLA